jgi:hypothetical protein
MPTPEKLTVEVGMTIPHPEQRYASIRAGLTIQAVLGQGENPKHAVAALERQLVPMLQGLVRRTLEAETPLLRQEQPPDGGKEA